MSHPDIPNDEERDQLDCFPLSIKEPITKAFRSSVFIPEIPFTQHYLNY